MRCKECEGSDLFVKYGPDGGKFGLCRKHAQAVTIERNMLQVRMIQIRELVNDVIDAVMEGEGDG